MMTFRCYVPVRILLAAILLAAAAPVGGPARAEGEMISTWRLGFMLRNRVHFAWQLRKFDQLEALADELRTTKLRDEAGMVWLTSFYDGFTVALNNHVTPADYAEELWNKARLEWIKKYPNSPTPHIAHARFLYELAWKARGNGYASTVFPEQWKTFRTRLVELRDYLKKNTKVASADPEFANQLAATEFLLTNDHKQLHRNIANALKKNPRYMEYYFTEAVYSLPEWGGTAESFYSILRRASEGGKKTDGTGLLARVYTSNSGGPFSYADIENQGPFWPVVKKSIADDLEHFPHWRLARKFLEVACKARDAELVDRLNGMLIEAAEGRRHYVPAALYCEWGKQPEAQKRDSAAGQQRKAVQ